MSPLDPREVQDVLAAEPKPTGELLTFDGLLAELREQSGREVLLALAAGDHDLGEEPVAFADARGELSFVAEVDEFVRQALALAVHAIRVGSMTLALDAAAFRGAMFMTLDGHRLLFSYFNSWMVVANFNPPPAPEEVV